MTGLIIIACILLIGVILVQIGRVTELAAKIRGEEEAVKESYDWNARFCMVFLIGFLIFCFVSGWYYKDSILWYGPHQSASEHGGELDSLFNVTLFFTGIVFVVTQILLFWYSYKYRYRVGVKSKFISHDTRLEIVWTMIPAVVMSFLVIRGLVAWNNVMADVDPTEEYIEIEATGMQFAWLMRYPGADGVLGKKDYRLITASNQLGQDWTDPKNFDDVVSAAAGEVIKLPKGKKVRVRITARDVLHNFDLPHFRVKMDAIPGIPTYFVFTPALTTAEYRENLREYPEWNEPYDPEDPDAGTRWENFNYELACAELCGKGHYSMRRIIEVVEPAEWEEWMAQQQSYYLNNVRGSDEDPFKGELLSFEIEERTRSFNKAVETALASEDEAAKVLRLDNVRFETGSANLTPLSRYEIDNLAGVMSKYPNMTIQLAGHTDNTGDADQNQELSERRANTVKEQLVRKGVAESRLVAVGYGQNQPVADNATEDGRRENRRTEFRIITQ